MTTDRLRVEPAQGRAVSVVDLAATAVFGLEGGVAGVAAGLDVFGVAVVGLVTATGGGMARDTLMGSTPPRALRTIRYLVAGITGGLLAMVLHSWVEEAAGAVTVLDAIGLSLFAVSGASIALAAGLNGLTSVLLGTLSAVGGGVARDVLLDEVPLVLRADIYALAAAVGAAVVVAGWRSDMGRGWLLALGAGTCFFARMLAVWLDWHLPVPG